MSSAAEQVKPQSMPAGELVMDPVPVPLVLTASVACAGGGGPKFAVTLLSESSFTEHPEFPEQAPPHPVKTKPCFGLTVRATVVPVTKLVEQDVPQLMPPGLLEMVPPEVGFAATERA